MIFKSMLTRAMLVSAGLISAASMMAADELSLQKSNYTMPAWTRLQRMLADMEQGALPYSINMTVNGDPATRMAFAWFTNPSVTAGQVQIVEKAGAVAADFATPTLTIEAVSSEVKGLNYSIAKNNLTGIEPNQKVDYTSHKALATDLKPATTYSYRVGNEQGWSQIGQFTTASGAKDESYSFIYITDTQAQYDSMFDVSQKTVHTAIKNLPDAAFVLCNGDLVETSGSSNSEWEYEQWFATMQDVWMKYPLVVTMGNHDTSANSNFYHHFNNSTEYNASAAVPTAMNGTVFSFVRGDVLFMVINYEDWAKQGYLASLADWMRAQVNAHPEVKWRVASFHKNMFTGSKSHQDDGDGKAVRLAMLPVFDELKIDIALEGHDHIYEVIGPVNNSTKTLVEGAVEHVEIVGDAGARENMTGKQGGTFNVADGTLYFLNNSAGRKKYEPRNEDAMEASFAKHEVENYWGLFSGKFGQTGEPTYSRVDVTPEAFTISTYTVDDAGNPTLFDSFRVIKEKKDDNTTATPEVEAQGVSILREGSKVVVKGFAPDTMSIYTPDGTLMKHADNVAELSIADLAKGVYVVRAAKTGDTYSTKVVID